MTSDRPFADVQAAFERRLGRFEPGVYQALAERRRLRGRQGQDRGDGRPKRLPFRSAVAWAKDRWVAVGTSGSHVSRDDGDTWTPLDRENYNAVGFTPTGEGWAIGPKGRIAAFAERD